MQRKGSPWFLGNSKLAARGAKLRRFKAKGWLPALSKAEARAEIDARAVEITAKLARHRSKA